MTKDQYAKYEQAVADFHKQHGLDQGLTCCGPADPDAEPFFSWRPCPCCGSGLGGNRELYRFTQPKWDEDSAISAAICTDCVYYLTYGQLDDMTMLEIEANP